MLVTLGSHLNQGKKIWRYKKEKDNEIKNKTRYLFDELIRKPVVSTSDVDLGSFVDTPSEIDEFFKTNNSKVPTQDEVDR